MHRYIGFLIPLLFLSACNDPELSSPIRDGKAGTFDESGLAPEIAAGMPQEPAGTSALPSAAIDAGATPPKPVTEKNRFIEDKVSYDLTPTGSLPLANVDETPSRKRQTILLNGTKVSFIASAGHLVTYGPKSATNSNGKTAQASIFYTAYTREDIPPHQRPVTFLYNGGPGSASIWLHLGAWGPRRLVTNIPNLPDAMPDHMDMVDNDITLLDQTDLVFVDPVGTGYSMAIAPFKNIDFLKPLPDAEMVRDFVTSYTNRFNRQSSPKYLYGESYSGIRIPIAARLLLEAGTTNFEPDPSGMKPNVLSGVVLNSPIMDYSANCDKNPLSSCAGFLPSYATIADYHGKSKAKDNYPSHEAYIDALRKFAEGEFTTALANYRHAQDLDKKAIGNIDTAKATCVLAAKGDKKKEKVCNDQAGKDKKQYARLTGKFGIAGADKQALDRLQELTGVAASVWRKNFNMKPNDFKKALMPGWKLGRYDARTKLPTKAKYLPDDFADKAFENALGSHLRDYVNYSNSSSYKISGNSWNRDNWKSTTDIAHALSMDPTLRYMVIHGYADTATPFFQSELDLRAVKLANLVPVTTYEGGHMMYYTENSRAPLKKTLDNFYRNRPAASPTANSTSTQLTQ